MTSLQRGQVVDVDLEPTKGSETGKIRPCIVVTNLVLSDSVEVFIPRDITIH
jgi:mRNA interferase MazF